MNFKNHKQLVLTIMAVALGACSQDPKTPAGGGGGGSGNGANAVEAPSKVVFCRNGDDALTLQFYKSNKSAVLLQDDEITSKGVEYNFNGTVLSYSSTSTLEYMGDSVSGDIYTEEVDGKSVEVFVSETESSKRTHADLVVEDSSGVKVFQPFSCQSKSDIQGYYNNEFHDDLQNYTQREVLDFDSDEDGKISVEEATQILLSLNCSNSLCMTPENLGLIKYTEDDGLNYLSNEDWESFTQDVSEYLNISLDKKKKVEQLQ